MAAAFDNPAFAEDEDLVRVDDRRQAMRDHQRRARLRHFVQRGLDFLFRAAVKRRCRFVKQEDRRLLQDGAGNGDPLLLAARQLQTPFTDHGFIPVRQCLDEPVNGGHARGGLDLVRGGAGATIADVVADGGVEHHRILRNHADRRAHRGLRDLGQVLPVDPHGTGLRIVEAEQQPRNGRLPRSAWPDDGHPLALRHFKADAAQDRAVLIGEVHILETDRAAFDMKVRRAATIADANRFVEETEHALHIHQRLTQLAIEPAKEVQRHIELQKIGVHRHKIADGEPAFLNVQASHAHHQHHANGDDRALPDIHDRQRGPRAHRHLLIALQRLVIALCLVGLGVEIFHRLVIQQRIHGAGRRLFISLIHLATELDPPFGHTDGEIGIGRHGQHGHSGIEPAKHQPQDDADHHHLDEQRQHFEKDNGQQKFDALRAAVNGAGQTAGLPLQMKTQRQLVQIGEAADGGAAHRALRHLGEQILFGLGKHLLAKPGQRIADNKHQQDFQRETGLAVHHIDSRAIQQRRDDVGATRRHKCAERSGDPPPHTPVTARCCIAPQLAEKRKGLVQSGVRHLDVCPTGRQRRSGLGRDGKALAAPAARNLVRVVEHEARGEFRFFPVHFRADQKHHRRRVNQERHALFLDLVLKGFGLGGVLHIILQAGTAGSLDPDAKTDDVGVRTFDKGPCLRRGGVSQCDNGFAGFKHA